MVWTSWTWTQLVPVAVGVNQFNMNTTGPGRGHSRSVDQIILWSVLLWWKSLGDNILHWLRGVQTFVGDYKWNSNFLTFCWCASSTRNFLIQSGGTEVGGFKSWQALTGICQCEICSRIIINSYNFLKELKAERAIAAFSFF